MPALADALRVLGDGRNLTGLEAAAAITEIIDGAASEAAIAAFLTALRVKGETAEELSGAVQAILGRITDWEGEGLPSGLLDTCGTGGDGANTVNVSTAVAIVVAACGAPVAKHGNRSASGNSGSAEVLGALGVAVEVPMDVVRRCLSEVGLTFLFAPRYHPGLKHAAAVRRQLPFRTLFNLVGPLANPARPEFQLVGVAGERQAGLMANALARLGIRRAAVVTGSDGLDEVTLDGPTQVNWVESGRVTSRLWNREDFGLPRVSAAELRVSGPAESAARILRLLQGEPGPVRDIVLANSAAALLVVGRAETLADGVAQAREAIDSGGARQRLERWRQLSQRNM